VARAPSPANGRVPLESITWGQPPAVRAERNSAVNPRTRHSTGQSKLLSRLVRPDLELTTNDQRPMANDPP